MHQQHPQPALRLLLLGRFVVELDQRPLPPEAWRRRRASDLLKLLALAPGLSQHREEIIDRLWPHKDLETGANNLYRALHDLRQVIGEEWVSLDKGTVRLDPAAYVDVVAFEEHLQAADVPALSAALRLYRGDLCSDDPYAEPLQDRRRALRQRFTDAALLLGRKAAALMDLATATWALRRLLELEPAHEEAHRALMRVLAQAGRREEALQQFAACAEALRQAGSEPAAETVALQQGLLSGAPAAPRRTLAGWRRMARRFLGTADPPPLRGRDAEVAALRELIQRGEGAVVLIGEAGVGKTRLAVEGARLAEAAGAVILAGAALDLEGLPPFSPFLDAWADHLRAQRGTAESPFSAFVPTPGGAPQEDKLRLFQSVERALLHEGGGRPVYLALEDLHHADESSLHLLHYLARATRTQPLLLCATCREEDVRLGTPLQGLLSALHRERLAHRVAVRGLSRGATAELVTDLLGAPAAPERVDEIYALAQGNPFYTEEVVLQLQEQGRVGVPDDLAAALRERVRRLGADVERLAVTASAIGQRFDFEVVRQAADLCVGDALTALERAVAGRLVEEDDRRYRFRHALLREALYGVLMRERRVDLHRRVAAALEAVGDDSRGDLPASLAFHYRMGEQPDRALPHLVAAGRRAASQAGLQEAVAFFEQALRAMDAMGAPPGPQRLELMLGLGWLKVALSEVEAAVVLLDAAAELRGESFRPTPGQRARCRRAAVLALITSGDLPGADRRLQAALAELPEADPEMPEVLYHLAQLRWHQGRYQEAYQAAERCLLEAEKHGNPEVLARGYEMLALCCHSLGEWREGIGFEERRQSLSGGALDVAQVFDVHL